MAFTLHVPSYTAGLEAGRRLKAKRYAGEAPTPVAYLYNGMRLPPLPEGLGVCMISVGVFGGYTLYNGKSIAYREIDGKYQLGLNDPQPSWYGSTSSDVWSKSTSTPTSDPFWLTDVGSDFIAWTNTNILNKDGTISLAASEPVPVYE